MTSVREGPFGAPELAKSACGSRKVTIAPIQQSRDSNQLLKRAYNLMVDGCGERTCCQWKEVKRIMSVLELWEVKSIYE
jgi:hypothetical protein